MVQITGLQEHKKRRDAKSKDDGRLIFFIFFRDKYIKNGDYYLIFVTLG